MAEVALPHRPELGQQPQHLAVLGVAAILYPILWKAADWDPRFIDVMMTALQETPPTRNRSIHGGDSYAP